MRKFVWMFALLTVLGMVGYALKAVGQTAKVIQLTPDEAKQAKALYDEQQALAKRQQEFDAAISHKYTETPSTLSVFSKPWTTYSTNSGWENGFVYSENFKFIVPKPYVSQIRSYPNNCWSTVLTGNDSSPSVSPALITTH